MIYESFFMVFFCKFVVIMKSIAFSLCLVLILFISKVSNASHAAGLDVTYECISTNQYRVTLTFYRECGGVGAPNGTWNGYLNVYSPSSGNTASLNLIETTLSPVPVFPTILSSPSCPYTGSCSGGSTLQTQIYTYEGIVNLPSQRSDWTILAAMYARNPGISTVNSADDYDICVRAVINNTNSVGCNSSPVWDSPPTSFLCVNSNNTYSTSASDADGDSIVYSMINPMNNWTGGIWGGYSTVVNNVPYNGGYSYTNPLSGTTTFDPITGNMSFAPTLQQTSIWAIKAEEYRNGVLIGSMTRDIQTTSLVCNSNPPNLTGIDTLLIADTTTNSFNFCANGNAVMTFDINALTSPPNGINNITMSVSGIPTTATFTIFNNGTNNPIGTFTWAPQYINLLNSPYLFTVNLIDDACISNTASFTYKIDLTSNAAFTVQNLITNEGCVGYSDGAIDITILGVSGAPTFSWTGPNGFSSVLEDISGLMPGAYFLEITSPDACLVTYSYDVLSDSVTLSETHADLTCFGSIDGSIDLSASGGASPYIYSWIDSTLGFTYSTEDLTSISDGNYWCTVTDANGCSPLPYQVIITEPEVISTSLIQTDISCFGGADGSINLNAIGGTAPLSISWSGPNGFYSNSDSLLALEAGIYSAIVTDGNNCPPVNQQVTLIEDLLITASYLPIDISCFGKNDGSINLTISGGKSPYFVTWQGPNGFFSNLEDINNLVPGLYSLSVIDDNLCLLPSSIQVLISEPAEISYSYTKTNVSCYGGQSGAIDLTANGGTGFLTVTWNHPDGYQIITEDINGIGSGIYSFIISDVNSCTTDNIPLPIFITEPSQIIISANIQNELCYGDANGVIDITVSNANGPFNYSWNGPQLFSSALEDIVGLSSGSYQLIVTDNSNFCTNQASFVVSSGMQLQITSSVSNVSCNGDLDGSINLNTFGLSNPVYAWSNGETSEDIFNLSVGNYSVLLTDDANCPSYFSFAISEPSSLYISSNVFEVSCVGGSNGEININVTGGTPPYNYIWSNGNVGAVNPLLTEGNYLLSVTDLNNCILQDSFLLLAKYFHVKANVTNPKCYGGTDGLVDIEIIGGDYPFVYNWSSGQTSQDVINLGAGGYFLNISDALNCTIDTLILVNEPSAITAITNTIDASCFGTNTGSVSMQVMGGSPPYVIDWGNVDVSAMYSGVFSYQITDTTACTYTNTVTILQNDSIGASYVKTDVQCYGENTGDIDLQIMLGSGTPPYSYQWNGPNLFSSNSEDINNLIAGHYTVLITDANFCTKEVQLVIDEPTPLNQIVDITISDYTGFNIACKGDNSGWVNIDVNGGYIPFSYAWSTGSVNDSIFGLFAGNYNVTITDGLDCTIDYAINLQEPISEMLGNIISISDYNNFDISCYGKSDGAIEEVVSGGAGIYTYEWNNGMNNSSIFNLTAGYYEVIVYDNNGCLWMDSITLDQPDSLSLILQISSDTCERGVGYAEVSLTGGVPYYNFIWSSGQLTAVINNFSEGVYEIIASDANQCKKTNLAVIENLPSPNIDFLRLPEHKRYYLQKEKPFVFADLTETFWQNVVSWEWEFGDSTFGSDSIVFHSYDQPGEYIVYLTIETEYNCIDTISKKVLVDEYEIFIPNAFTPSVDDELNNEFKPYGYGVKKFVMKIYDRWGAELFETNTIDKGWDGRTEINGKIAPTGTYLYFIEVENIYGGVIIYQDGFKLIR